MQKTYGLPVDNRTPTSLIDWALWSIAAARNPRGLPGAGRPIFRYANETPVRVPLSDWFVTTEPGRDFQARPVVGGIFIRMLTDATGWARWAATVAGDWAPLPAYQLSP